MIRQRFFFPGILLAATGGLCAAGEVSSRHGLGVVDGVLSRHGTPYRGIGVNCFSLFSRSLRDPGDRSYEEGLRKLGDAGIPFARFMCCGFWPNDWAPYRADRADYFRRLDAVVRSAETHGVGLVPSLFWHTATVPDIVGEPIDQLGNPESKTIAFIRRYTAAVVRRYRDSPAIWGWEFGNEYNLGADLPNAAKHRPRVVPQRGTPAARTARDELTAAQMLTAFGAFAATVRQHDPYRFISTGNSRPRPSAWHNRTAGTWTPDSPAEFGRVLIADNPDPYDTISVHIYPRKGGYAGGYGDAAAFCRAMKEISRAVGKPVFVGEFGVPAKPGDPAGEKKAFAALLAAVEKGGIPLAALWVYDHAGQEEWNVTVDNDRAWMLQLIAAANRRRAVPR